MPAEECWLPGRLVMGKELATEVLLGTSRPLYCETPDRPWTSHFLEAARADDVPAARDLMLSIRNVADGIFARHHARGAHEVALTKAVTAMFGMATGTVRPPLGYPAAEMIGETRAPRGAAGLRGACAARGGVESAPN